MLASICDHRLLSLLTKRNQSDTKTPVRHCLTINEYFEIMAELNSIYATEIANKPKFPAPAGNLDCEIAIIGGGLLVAADLFSRSLLAPVELPVGIVTTLLGAPVFVILVARWSKGLWL